MAVHTTSLVNNKQLFAEYDNYGAFHIVHYYAYLEVIINNHIIICWASKKVIRVATAFNIFTSNVVLYSFLNGQMFLNVDYYFSPACDAIMRRSGLMSQYLQFDVLSEGRMTTFPFHTHETTGPRLRKLRNRFQLWKWILFIFHASYRGFEGKYVPNNKIQKDLPAPTVKEI